MFSRQWPHSRNQKVSSFSSSTPHSSKSCFTSGFVSTAGSGESFAFLPIHLIFMDVHDRIIEHSLRQEFSSTKGIKGISLASCRQRSYAAKKLVHKGTSQLLCVFGIIEKSVDVCTSVIKYREQESQIWHFYDPVTDTVFDVVGFCVVAQSGFGRLTGQMLQRIWS